jgi:hypothetical protein
VLVHRSALFVWLAVLEGMISAVLLHPAQNPLSSSKCLEIKSTIVQPEAIKHRNLVARDAILTHTCSVYASTKLWSRGGGDGKFVSNPSSI